MNMNPSSCGGATSRFFCQKRKSPEGFTLIELLVVISIITILISILLPALSRGRAQAVNASCGSHLRQMAIGLTTYANDYDGYLPARAAWSHLIFLDALTMYSPTPDMYRSGFYQAGYVSEPLTFFCPANAPAFTSPNVGEDPDWSLRWKTEGSMATTNSYMYMAGNKELLIENGHVLASAIRIFDRGNLRLMQDATYRTVVGEIRYNHSRRTKSDSFDGFSGANASYLDGHVDWLSAEQVDLQKVHNIGSLYYVY